MKRNPLPPGQAIALRVAAQLRQEGVDPATVDNITHALAALLEAGPDVPLRSQVGPLLRRARAARGLSQAALADRMQVTRRSVERWESPATPIDLAQLEVAGRVLGVRWALVTVPQESGLQGADRRDFGP